MSNVIKFQAPFERLKLYSSSPDVILRKAIITQAMIDATNISECREAKKLELEAKTWIFGTNEFFKEICIEAGIEPSFVVKLTKALIKLHKDQSRFRNIIQKEFRCTKNKKQQSLMKMQIDQILPKILQGAQILTE